MSPAPEGQPPEGQPPSGKALGAAMRSVRLLFGLIEAERNKDVPPSAPLVAHVQEARVMSRHLQRDIENLKVNILSLGAMVEESVYKAVKSIETWDAVLAREVVDQDWVIDKRELEVEDDCLKILALHQPVAFDLRFIVSTLKINNDLERIGDLAVNIAERGAFLAKSERIRIPFDLPGMATKVQSMLRKSLDALVNTDPDEAREVCAADDEVDQINREMYSQISASIRSRPEQVDSLIHLLSVSRFLERISDHATNISEDVIYMTEGEIVRHQLWRTRPVTSPAPPTGRPVQFDR